jgi:hypothetical protein
MVRTLAAAGKLRRVRRGKCVKHIGKQTVGLISYLAAFRVDDDGDSRVARRPKLEVRWDRVAIIAGCALFWAIAAFFLL